MVKQAHATTSNYERAFEGLHFPTSQPAIQRKAADHGGLDAEVNDILRRIPDIDYPDLSSLRDAIRKTYRDEGFDEESIPV